MGGPQGIEFAFRDFPLVRTDVSFGAFAQPKLVTDQFYYNVWARWGKGPYFVEFNYISWLEQVRDEKVYSRSIGISAGFPLARFF